MNKTDEMQLISGNVKAALQVANMTAEMTFKPMKTTIRSSGSSGKSRHKSQTNNETTTITTSTPTDEEDKKSDVAIESYEAQENIHSTVLADPPNSSLVQEARDSRVSLTGRKEENEEEEEGDEVANLGEDDHLERRAFMTSGITEEVKKLRNHHRNKLLTRAQLKKRKKQKKGTNTAGNKKREVNAFVKTSLIGRQGSTTVGYGTLQQDWAQQQQKLNDAIQQNNNVSPLSSSLRQHFPLQLSTTVQRLIFDKLNPPNALQALRNQLQNSPDLHYRPKGSNPFFSHHTSLGNFADADSVNDQWQHPPDTFPSIRTTNNLQGAKMIPIEIIGLDPQVAKSILQSDSSESNNPLAESSASSSSLSSSLFSGASAARLTSSSLKRDRPAPSIVHIHHFHTQTKPPLLPEGTNSKTQISLQQPQAYLNDKGELVYLPSGSEQSGVGESSGELPGDSSAVGSGTQASNGANPRQHQQQQQQMLNNEQQELNIQQPTSNSSGGDVSADQTATDTLSAGAKLLRQAQSDQFSGSTVSGGSSQISELVNSVNSGLRSKLDELTGAGKERVFFTTNGQTISVISRPNTQQDTPGTLTADGDSKMLMVAYKPKPQQVLGLANLVKNNSTSGSFPASGHDEQESHSSQLTKSPYNEGQESKASLVSTGTLVLRPLNSILQPPTNRQPAHELPTMDQVNLRLAHLSHLRPLLLDPLNTTGVVNRTPNFSVAASKLNAHQQLVTASPQAAGNNSGKLQQQIEMENRVPFDSSQTLKGMSQQIRLDQQQLGNNNFQSSNNGSWLINSKEFEKQHHLNGYNAGRIFPVAGFKNNSIVVPSSLTDSNQLVPLFKQQQQLLAQITNPQNGTTRSGLNNEELVRKLLRELKLNGNNLQTTNVGLGLPTNSLIHTDQLLPELLLNGTQLQKVSYNKDLKSSNLIETTRKTNNPLEKQSVRSAVSEQTEFSDTIGISNIALTIIFLFSLITLIIIAASMIYRHKRRSIGRCATRSRLNLTQRTKRFMRSNFVRPNHGITPIKSINHLDIGSSNSVQSKTGSSLSSLGTSNKTSSGLTATVNSSDHLNNTAHKNQSTNLTCRVADRYINKQTFCQPQMSTFNSSAHSSSQFTEDSTADIKTLNTRLQKSTFLKSLISTPDCSHTGPGAAGLSGSNVRQQQSRSNKPTLTTDSSNVSTGSTNKYHHHPHHLLHHNHQLKPKSPSNNCRRSHSFKKSNSCESHLHNYSFAFKNSPFASEHGSSERISLNSKMHNNSDRMSTIHSMSDNNDLKSLVNRESPAQFRRQNNISYRASELNNLMTPKQLVSNSTAHSNQSEDRTHMDRL